MTTMNVWPGKIRWLAGETLSEPFVIGDAVYLSILFPSAGAPTGPFEVQGQINREGDFRFGIVDEAGAGISVAAGITDQWISFDASRRAIIPFYYLRLDAGVAPVADYEAVYVAKRP
jgi:hypothetical protein